MVPAIERRCDVGEAPTGLAAHAAVRKNLSNATLASRRNLLLFVQFCWMPPVRGAAVPARTPKKDGIPISNAGVVRTACRAANRPAEPHRQAFIRVG